MSEELPLGGHSPDTSESIRARKAPGRRPNHFFTEIHIATSEADAVRIVPILKRWSSDLRQILPMYHSGWGPQSRVQLWMWTEEKLKDGDTPEKAHRRLLERVRRKDPRARVIAFWGERIDQWTITFDDWKPPPEVPTAIPPQSP